LYQFLNNIFAQYKGYIFRYLGCVPKLTVSAKNL